MRLKYEEVEEYGINLKGWIAHMQLDGKRTDVDRPVFALKGPEQLKVRTRRASGPAAVSTRTHPFYGGEKFSVGGFAVNDSPREQEYQILVTLVPVDMSLARDISGMTLQFSEFIEKFEGAEEWVESFGEQKHSADVVLKKPVPGRKTVDKRPLKEIHESNPSWGCW